LFIADKPIASLKKNDEITAKRAPVAESHPIGRESTRFVLHCAPSFVMMQKHASDLGTNQAESRSSGIAFHVHSAIHQHGRVMDRGLANHVLGLRDLVLGLD
jgi:hypothetical protein